MARRIDPLEENKIYVARNRHYKLILTYNPDRYFWRDLKAPATYFTPREFTCLAAAVNWAAEEDFEVSSLDSLEELAEWLRS